MRFHAMPAGILLALLSLPAEAQEGVGEAGVQADTAPAKAAAGPPVAGEEKATSKPGRGGVPEPEREIHVGLPGTGDPAIDLVFGDRGGTLASARLLGSRYTREAWPAMAGVPETLVAEGPIELVTAWSPKYRPFRIVFGELSVEEETTLVLRRGAGARLAGGVLTASSTLEIDRPVHEGDRVRITAPESAAGSFTVSRVTSAGALELKGERAAPDAEGVAFEVSRTGPAKDLAAGDVAWTRVSEPPGLPLVYVWPDPRTDTSAIWIEKRFEAGRHPYELLLTVTLHTTSAAPVRAHVGLEVSGWQHPQLVQSSMFSMPTQLYAGSCYTGESLERHDYPSLVEEPQAFRTESRWAGIDTRYFLLAAAAVDLQGAQCRLEASAPPPAGNGVVSATLLAPSVEVLNPGKDGCVPDWLAGRGLGATCGEVAKVLGHDVADGLKAIRATWQSRREDAAGPEKDRLDAAWNALKGRQRSVYRFTLFAGPKESERLAESGHSLSESLDFGWLTAIADPMVKLLAWFFSLTGHWALAILLLTVLVKLLLLPLTNKSFKSMLKMQQLAPEMKKIKEQHKDDREAQGRATMALYKREKVNPAAGCVPMLLQMPIWFALYQTILSSVELYHAPLGGWIQDLSSADPWFVLPVLLGLLMLVQSYFTPDSPGMDPVQQKIMKYGMPAMFSVFMVALPSGLVLYILINTALTILQNIIIKRRLT